MLPVNNDLFILGLLELDKKFKGNYKFLLEHDIVHDTGMDSTASAHRLPIYQIIHNSVDLFSNLSYTKVKMFGEISLPKVLLLSEHP